MRSLRIVGGEWRGRRLCAPKGDSTRPTADRVRESLFNILMADVRDANVLDLFSGSGALALEALSRGAASATLVDVDRNAQQTIARNIETLGAHPRAKLIKSDWHSALASFQCPFDLVFLDPPYALLDVYAQAASALAQRHLLAPGAILVMEHRATDPLVLPAQFSIFDERRYGEAKLSFVCEVPPS